MMMSCVAHYITLQKKAHLVGIPLEVKTRSPVEERSPESKKDGCVECKKASRRATGNECTPFV